MIRFGPAGIPLSCKGRTLEDGIEDVHNLSLTALEIQMVRAGTFETYPEEEDVGIPYKDLDGRFIVEIIRDDEPIYDPNTPVEEEDVLIQMVSGVADNFGMLYDLGTMAKRLDVAVSLHTPNYMDLGTADSPLTEQCVSAIMHAGLIVNALGGDIVTTNLGLYNGEDDEETDNNIYDNIGYIMDWWNEVGLKPKLGIEITGNQNVFGSLEQVCDICSQFDNLVPVINWPNYHSRSRDNDINNMILDAADDYLLEAENFKNVIDDVAPFYKGGNIHTIFSGIEHNDENRYRLTPIKKGDLKFDTLAECLVDMKPNMTVISSSPLLEHDAMYMRIIHERALSKKVAKALRLKKKEEADALAAAAAAAEANTDSEEE